ncbi:hypothetical protein [Actinosynnema sp. NPDC023926]
MSRSTASMSRRSNSVTGEWASMPQLVRRRRTVSRTRWVVWVLIRSMSPSLSGPSPACQPSTGLLRHALLTRPLAARSSTAPTWSGSMPTW